MRAGLMQDTPLELRQILLRAQELFPEKTLTSAQPTGYQVATYATVLERAGRLAATLTRDFDIRPGDCVASLAWNSQSHLEVALAVPGLGGVHHALNARLDPRSIAAQIEKAGDNIVFVDAELTPVLLEVALPDSVTTVVVLNAAYDNRRHSDLSAALNCPVLDLESLVAAADRPFAWPRLDERMAAGLCFTSGTTGKPKGVLYSHRSTVLHAMALLFADGIALRECDVCAPTVPQFHANGWGFPHAALLCGASLAFAGRATDPVTLAGLFDKAGVTVATAVPTVWHMLLEALRDGSVSKDQFASLERLPVGGAAVPEALIEGFAAYGVHVQHCWGMTEISPLGTVNVERSAHSPSERSHRRLTQGAPLPLCRVRVECDDGAIASWDGETAGELQITGPWVARSYLSDAAAQPSSRPSTFVTDDQGDVWLRTGDLASIHPDGFVQLLDRTKDLIKSGGEWISSIALESALMARPDVLEAAVVARPDAKWGERPVAYIAPRTPHAAPGRDAVHEYLASSFAKWQLPDEVIELVELPKGPTGKVDKMVLRELAAQEKFSGGDT